MWKKFENSIEIIIFLSQSYSSSEICQAGNYLKIFLKKMNFAKKSKTGLKIINLEPE